MIEHNSGWIGYTRARRAVVVAKGSFIPPPPVATASSGRGRFGRALWFVGLLSVVHDLGAADPETFTYKKVGALEIRADVYRPAADGHAHPVVVWIHGGALINGGRQRDPGLERQFIDMLNGHGFVFVSIDYRLAPETRLPEIVNDVVDAFRWIREQGPALFDADPSRLAVAGSSAGGYLTLAAGFKVKPRPVALVSMWGYGDLVGPWYSEPSTQPRHLESRPTRDEAWSQVSGPPIANARDRKGNGSVFYQYCRQHGEWPHAVSGWDPHTEAAKFFPYMPVKNVTADYPPALLIHGTADTDVPYEQSVLMAGEFARHGVEYKLVSVPNAEHGLKGNDPHLIEAAYNEAAEFLRKHLLPGAARAAPATTPKS